jgi:hypothetical protein
MDDHRLPHAKEGGTAKIKRWSASPLFEKRTRDEPWAITECNPDDDSLRPIARLHQK